MEAYGITEEMLPAHIRKPSNCEVWPEHADAVLIFLKCSTQWRTGPNGLVGLDYSVVLPLMDLCQVDDKLTVLDDLQVMEHYALTLIRNATK